MEDLNPDHELVIQEDALQACLAWADHLGKSVEEAHKLYNYWQALRSLDQDTIDDYFESDWLER